MTTTQTQIDETQLAEQLRTFGQAFKTAHTHAKLSKRSLAATVSMDRAGITKIERGKRAPNFGTLLELARAVEATPEELLGGIGPIEAIRLQPQYAGRPPSDPRKRFAANLKWARRRTKDPHLNQFDLAWKARVDRSSLSGYETGRLAPNLRTILKLAMALEIGPDVLFEGVALAGARAQRAGQVGGT